MSEHKSANEAYLRGQLDTILADMLTEMMQAQHKMKVLIEHGNTLTPEAFMDGLLQIETHRIQLHTSTQAAAAKMQALITEHKLKKQFD